MDDFTFAVLCMSILAIAYLLQSRKPSTPATRLPPSPPKLPFIGHLHLLTDMPHQSLARLANKFGPIFYLQLGQVPTIVVSSPQVAELVLKTHDNIFANRPTLASSEIISFGSSDVTFSTYGPYWRQVRKISINELLSPKRVKEFQDVREEEVTLLVEAVSSQCGVQTNVTELIFRFSSDMLCRAIYGKRFNPEESGGFLSTLVETVALTSGFCIGDFYPSLGWLMSVTGMTRRLMKNSKELSALCDDIINEHLKKKKDGSARREDLVDVLLRAQKHQHLEVHITTDNIKAVILDMFLAGTDATAIILEWTLTELVRHPEVMKKAQDEIRGIVGSKGEVEESHLHQFRYVKSAIKESMRLHPIAPFLAPHESMERCTLNGYDVPKNTRVLVNTYAIGRDPNSWENPLVYDPERHVEKDIEFKGQDFRFLPFGNGRRGCPGSAFGLAIIELALARLLYHFNWQLPSGIGPNDVDVEEVFGLSVRKKTTLILVPSKFKNHGAEEYVLPDSVTWQYGMI